MKFDQSDRLDGLRVKSAAMNLFDIQNMLSYTEWANELALAAAAQLPAESLHRDFGISHKSIFGTLVHMAGAEWIWLERWHGHSPAKDEAWSLWSTDSCGDLDTLKERWSQIIDRRTRYVSALDESQLAADLHFKLLSGDASSMPLMNQIHHVANHATMHRGQIVGMIRQLGLDPPATDLIFYLRREVSPK